MHQAILLATFSVYRNKKRTVINGMIEPILSYFLKNSKVVDIIDGAHPGSDIVDSIIESHSQNTTKYLGVSIISKILKPILLHSNSNGTQPIFKIRDFLSTLEWGLRSGKTYDLFIGLESIYTLAGIILRTFGRVKTVVYYVSDYSPKRYSSRLFNSLYIWLDLYCAKHSNYIWDVSPAMQVGRINSGLVVTQSAPVILVPNALFPTQVIQTSQSKKIKNSVVFAGTFGKENGLDIAVEAIDILKPSIPDISLHIFGGDNLKDTYLKNLVTSKKLSSNIYFHGFISDPPKLSKLVSKYALGIAPYRHNPDTIRAFGDATKLRLYMGAGLPVITTSVPPLGKELSSYGSALIVDDTSKAFADAIRKLLEDHTLHKRMSERAIKYATSNTWQNTYSHAISQMKIP